MKKTLRYALLSVLALMFLAGSAQAGVLAAADRDSLAVNPNTTPTYIPLDDAGNTSVTFSTASTQTIGVHFNADCAADFAGDFVLVYIEVDGARANGTSVTDSRLCGDTQLEGHERNAWASVGAGNHTVRVVAYTSANTGKLRRLVTLVYN